LDRTRTLAVAVTIVPLGSVEIEVHPFVIRVVVVWVEPREGE
jgi:hypothetical protein